MKKKLLSVWERWLMLKGSIFRVKFKVHGKMTYWKTAYSVGPQISGNLIAPIFDTRRERVSNPGNWSV